MFEKAFNLHEEMRLLCRSLLDLPVMQGAEALDAQFTTRVLQVFALLSLDLEPRIIRKSLKLSDLCKLQLKKAMVPELLDRLSKLNFDTSSSEKFSEDERKHMSR